MATPKEHERVRLAAQTEHHLGLLEDEDDNNSG